MQTAGWVLRLRLTDGAARIEYKGRTGEGFDEVGFGVDDAASAVVVITRIGLVPGLLIDRFRRQCEVGGCVLSWDAVEGLGDFVEIESSGEDESASAQRIVALRERLSLGAPSPPYGDVILARLEADPDWAADHQRRRDQRLARLRGRDRGGA